MLKMDIQKALSLPTCKNMMKDNRGGYCAWGGAYISIEGATDRELGLTQVEGGDISLETAFYVAYKLSCPSLNPSANPSYITPMEQNDNSATEEERQIARRRAVQFFLATGLVEPMDKDKELAKELTRVANAHMITT